MKIFAPLLLTCVLCCGLNRYIFSQTVEYIEEYSHTVLSDHFSGTQIDVNNWDIEDDSYLHHTAFIDSSATINVENGKLKLTTILCSNCSVGGYSQIQAAAGKVTSKNKFKYGIFESRIHFPRKKEQVLIFR